MGSTVGSVAFQLSVAIYPQHFQDYAWVVKYVWIVWAIIWAGWLLSHPGFLGRFFGKTANPAAVIPTKAKIVTASGESTIAAGRDVYYNSPPPTPKPEAAELPQVDSHPKVNNVVLVRPKSVFVDPGIQSVSLYQRENDTGLLALVACFRNEGVFGKDFANEYNVFSTVRYFDDKGSEIEEGITRLC